MEEVLKPYGAVTDNCVELIGKNPVSIHGKKGFKFEPCLVPVANPEKGLSICFWVKVEKRVNGWGVIFHCGPDPHRTPSTWIHSNSTRVHVRVSTTANTNEGSDSRGDVFHLNTWHHAAYVIVKEELSFFVDGRKVVAYVLQGNPVYSDGSHPFFIGHDVNYCSFHGQIKSFRCYSYALNKSEVNNDMHSMEPIIDEIIEEHKILLAYETLVNNPTHSDVTFRVDNIKIHGHRCILSVRSPYFHRLLGGSMKEASVSEISIEGVSAESFLALLRFLYVGRVPSDPEEAIKLMVVADYFSIDRKLVDQCWGTLDTKLTVNNACQLLCVADNFAQKSVIKSIMVFMRKPENYTRLVDSDELYTLPRPLLPNFLKFCQQL